MQFQDVIAAIATMLAETDGEYLAGIHNQICNDEDRLQYVGDGVFEGLSDNIANDNQFVIYSENESKLTDGQAGFWSNEDGWGDVCEATRFSYNETQSLSLPTMGSSFDSQYILLKEAEAINCAQTSLATSLQSVVDELVGEVEQHPSGFSSESDVKTVLSNIAADASLVNLEALVDVVCRYVLTDDTEMTEPVNKAKKFLAKSSLTA